jgi:hypothetical protein
MLSVQGGVGDSVDIRGHFLLPHQVDQPSLKVTRKLFMS